jgi:hypothetical protein
VIGARTTEEERLTTRRTWLRGRSSGRAALVLSFAGPGQPLDASLVPGTEVDAELAFHDGALPLRAVVAHQHGDASPAAEPPTANVTGLHAEYATALAADPWLAEWPVVLGGVVPVRAGEGWGLADAGGVVALSASSPPWPLLAASGGHPVTVSGEWQPATGFHVLMTWAA